MKTRTDYGRISWVAWAIVLCFGSFLQTGASANASKLGEVGMVRLSQRQISKWQTVRLEQTYKIPVVIMEPLSYEGVDPAHIRIRNVKKNSFQFKIEEWDYLDGRHGAEEEVSYLVVESGVHKLDNGATLQAGRTTMGGREKRVRLKRSLKKRPVVLASTLTYRDPSAVVVHITRTFKDAFRARLREQERNDKNGRSPHRTEVVGYIAIEPGRGQIGHQVYEAGVTSNVVKHKWYTLEFKKAFAGIPEFLAQKNSERQSDPSSLRLRMLDKDMVELFVEEEKSRDKETVHGGEQIGYFAIYPAGVLSMDGQTAFKLKWPIPGVDGRDWVVNNYVDLDSRRGFKLDYMGNTFQAAKTYDGHQAIDIDVPTFREMDSNVPILAAAAGTVVRVRDGQRDRYTYCQPNQVANLVEIEHDNGYITGYVHLKRDSIVVKEGKRVAAGEKLGVVGSSGCSSHPHLHFFVIDPSGKILEPFQEDLWLDPPEYDTPLGFMDAVLAHGSLTRQQIKDPGPNITSIPQGEFLSVGLSMAGGKKDEILLELLDRNRKVFDFFKISVNNGLGYRHLFPHEIWTREITGAQGEWELRISLNGRPAKSYDFTVTPPLSKNSATRLGEVPRVVKEEAGYGFMEDKTPWSQSGFNLAGVHYEHGFFTQPRSRVEYDLGGNYTTFSVCMGLHEGSPAGDCGDGARFRILGDGNVLFTSAAVRHRVEPANCISVPVEGVSTLTLIVDPQEEFFCDHAVWADGMLYAD